MVSCCLIAQPSEKIHFKKWQDQDGMSSNSVMSILKDTKGFYWFGTLSGLNRFDGYDFKQYLHDPSDKNSLSNNVVTVLLEYGNKIVVGTDAGLGILDRNTGFFDNYFHNVDDSTSLLNNMINGLSLDVNGELWVASNFGISHFQKQSESFINYDLRNPSILRQDQIFGLEVESDSVIWVASLNGLGKFDPRTKQIAYELIGNDKNAVLNEVSSICRSNSDSILWLGTGAGLVKYNKHTGRNELKTDIFDVELAYNYIIDMCYSDGNLWLGTRSGLYVYNIENDQSVRIESNKLDPYSLEANTVWGTYPSEDGIWIGTYAGGINYYNPEFSMFSTFFPDRKIEAQLKNNAVMSFLEDKEGNLWIGSDRQGLFKMSRDGEVLKNYMYDQQDESSISGIAILTLEEDQYGNIWVGTADNGVCIKPKGEEYFKRLPIKPNVEGEIWGREAWVLFRDSKNSMWVSTLGVGVQRFYPDGSKPAEIYHHIEGDTTSMTPDNLVWRVFEDSKNNIWLGSHGGILKFNESEKNFKVYSTDPNDDNSLRTNWTVSIFEDRNGMIWVGSYGGGLCRLNPENDQITRMSMENGGIPEDIMVLGILDDEHGYLWLSTSIGVLKYDPQQNITTRYSQAHGLRNRSYNIGAFKKLWDGRFLFGGHEGVDVFQPDDVVEQNRIPQMVLTDLFLFDNQIQPLSGDSILSVDISETKNITLEYNQNFLKIKFAGLHYISPENVQYRYKLEGLNENWVTADPSRTAVFTDLSPGTYVFKLVGSADGKTWSDADMEYLTIVITPPWWLTWWSKIGFALLAVILTYGLHRIRVYNLVFQRNRLNKKVKQRTAVIKRQNEKLEQRNQKLRQAEEKVRAMNKQLTNLNESLEEKVKARTSEIRKQNRKIKEYAFLNSHTVRAPLVRILGLLSLYKSARLSQSELNQFNDEIYNSAVELDDITKEINKELEDDF